MDLNPTALRTHFAATEERRAAIIEQARPLREQRDEIARTAQAQIAAIDSQIRTIEADLFDLSQEASRAALALGGQTGEPDA